MEEKRDTEDISAPKSEMEKPLSTPETSARDVEDMANAMLLDSPLPDAKRSNEGLPEGSGSDKLLEGEKGKKLPDGDDARLPEDTPTGKLIKPCTEKVYVLCS